MAIQLCTGRKWEVLRRTEGWALAWNMNAIGGLMDSWWLVSTPELVSELAACLFC